jgi:hypothetical protein
MHLTRFCGFALLLGGILTILINLILTPLVFGGKIPPLVIPTTNVFLWRQSASLVAALAMVFGCLGLGLHLMRGTRMSVFEGIAFFVALLGACLVVAVEFCDVFILRTVAQTSSTTFAALNKSTFVNVGIASAVGVFALGWILLSIGVWRARRLPRGPVIVALTGLILIPILQGALGVAGAMIGNAFFGFGLAALGWSLEKTASGAAPVVFTSESV